MLSTFQLSRSVRSRLLGMAALCLMSIPGLTPAQASHQTADEKARANALIGGAAFAPNGDLWLLRQDEQARLNLEISKDDGQSWQTPRLLDTGQDQIKPSPENNPKLVFGPKGVVLIAYARAFEKKFSGDIRLLRSTDGGAHFGAPVTLHQDSQQIGHSFAALAFDAKGVLHAVWLDARDKINASKSEPQASYRGSAIYTNSSLDGGASFGPDTKLFDHSCECCRIALTPTPNGKIAALWRHVTAPNIRDHAFAILNDATVNQSPVRATYDNWAIDACPHHGPALSPADRGGYHAVWFGLRADQAQVRYGRLDSAGKPVGNIQVLPDPRAEHADLKSSGKKLVIVWRSYDGRGMNLKAWISDDDGDHFRLKQLARTEDESDYPRLLSKDGKIFVLWNTMEKRHVEAL